MAKCLGSTMWEPITGQEKPTPDANLARLDLFIAMAWSDNSSSSPSRRLFNWICLWWQNCFAHWVFLSSYDPLLTHAHTYTPPTPKATPFCLTLSLSCIVTPSVCGSGCLFGSHGKRRGKWFSVASDFHYLFSIRPTYLWKKKQHVERKWQAETQPH